MRFFICFAAAMVWSLVVCGVMGWALVSIDPDRLNPSVGEMAASIGVLAAGSVLIVGGWCLTYHWVGRG